MIELKIPEKPEENTTKIFGLIVHLSDGDETTFVGQSAFTWTWRSLIIYTSEYYVYHYLIKDVFRLERVEFMDNIKLDQYKVHETFCFRR